jgi:hypothetical protein
LFATGWVSPLPNTSQNDPSFAFPPGHTLTIEVFKQGYSVFTRDAGEVFERANIYRAVGSLVRLGAQLFRQIIQRGTMEEHFTVNFYQSARIDQ